MTLAPETPRLTELLDVLAAADVTPELRPHRRVGGRDAARRSAAVGGRRLGATHLFNGMPPLHSRAPGPVAACLAAAARGAMVVELVGDGVHLADETVAMVFDLVGADRIALVTDAMAAAGMPDGRYPLGPMTVDVVGGIARLAADAGTVGAIAGGTARLLDVVRRTVRDAGVPLPRGGHRGHGHARPAARPGRRDRRRRPRAAGRPADHRRRPPAARRAARRSLDRPLPADPDSVPTGRPTDMEVVILPTPADCGRVVADVLAAAITGRAAGDRPTLGLATGSSPVLAYQELIRRHRDEGLSFAGARAFLLDEYVGLPADHPESYRSVIRRELTSSVDIADRDVHGPDGSRRRSAGGGPRVRGAAARRRPGRPSSCWASAPTATSASTSPARRSPP